MKRIFRGLPLRSILLPWAHFAAGFSFVGGVVAGYHIDFSSRSDPARSHQSPHPLAWLAEGALRAIRDPAAVNSVAVEPELQGFVLPPFTLPPEKPVTPEKKPTGFQSGPSNLAKLERLYRELIEADRSNAGSRMSTRPLVVANALSTQIPATKPGDTVDSARITLSSALSAEQQKQVAAILLGGTPRTPPRTPPAERAEQIVSMLDRQNQGEELALREVAVRSEVKVDEYVLGSCSGNSAQAFERVSLDPAVGESLTACPERTVWVSNRGDQQGWMRVESSFHRPTLARFPAPNGGATLLMDDMILASITIRKGLHITKGTGAIVGILPKGYKVEFTGRSEDTEYFTANRRSYFMILNAEPGPGVIELVPDQRPDQSTTVFVPVLEDVFTYLDLAPPVERDLTVKVVKNAVPNDSDVAGLTVGLSTHAGIHAITRSDGEALLRGVRSVRGYPVFVDVSSKSELGPGYTYRYELRAPDSKGKYVVNQIAEPSLHHWLSQVKQGLSDQGAMIVGAVDRKKIDGFRSFHTARVQPLTQKLGLEPLNYSVLWDGTISEVEPLEGDLPRYMAVQVSEGLSQVRIVKEDKETILTELIPVSPRVIHVVSP